MRILERNNVTKSERAIKYVFGVGTLFEPAATLPWLYPSGNYSTQTDENVCAEKGLSHWFSNFDFYQFCPGIYNFSSVCLFCCLIPLLSTSSTDFPQSPNLPERSTLCDWRASIISAPLTICSHPYFCWQIGCVLVILWIEPQMWTLCDWQASRSQRQQ